MQYDAESATEYLQALDDDWRRATLLELRRLIQAAGPDLEEGIQYKMLAYGDERGVVCHLNAQKHYVSLYVGNARKVDPGGELIAGLDAGKGCLRFKQSTRVGETRIEEFLERLMVLWNRGEDVGC